MEYISFSSFLIARSVNLKTYPTRPTWPTYLEQILFLSYIPKANTLLSYHFIVYSQLAQPYPKFNQNYPTYCKSPSRNSSQLPSTKNPQQKNNDLVGATNDSIY